MASAFAAAAGSSLSEELDNIEENSAEMWTSAPFSSSNALHKGLQGIEETLRCAICLELMRIPCSLPCKHTFCECCIQNHTKHCRKNKSVRTVSCPICREEVSGCSDISKALTPNSALEKVILSYKEIRSQLKQALLTANNNGAAGVTETETSSSTDNSNAPNSGRRKRSRKNYAENDDVDESGGEETENGNDDIVEVVERPKKLPKVSYLKKKKKQLQQLCKNEGLPQDGTEVDLRERHDAFITLYNTECNSIRPRSREKLVKEVMTQEKNRKREAQKARQDAKFMEQLKKNRAEMGSSEGGALVATSGNRAQDKKMNDQFNKMILQAKGKMPNSKSSPPNESGPSGSPSVSEKEGLPGADAATAANVASTRTPSNGVRNPYAKPRPSTGSVASANNNTVASFPSTTHMATPIGAAPGMFPNGTNAPSTIAKKQSQSFALSLSMSPSLHPIAAVAKTKVESPVVEEKGPLQPLLNPPSPNSSQENSKSTKYVASQSSSDATENAPENQPIVEAKPKAGAKGKPMVTKKSKQSKPKVASGTVASRPRPAPAPAQAPTRRSTRSIVGPWTCEICTYDNVKRTRFHSTASCEMCGCARPRA